MKRALEYFIFILMFFGKVESYSLDDVMLLHQTLLNTTVYDKTLRPGRNQSEPVTVRVRMKLDNLVEIDELAGTMTITATLQINWSDDRMTWDPKNFNGIEKAMFQKGDIWVPDMYALSSLSHNYDLGTNKFKVRYTHSGDATWEVSEMFSSTCDIDIVYYPLDSQSCLFTFTPNGYSPDDVKIKVNGGGVMKDTSYKSNSVWELRSASASVMKTPESDLFVIQVTYERRSIIYILTAIVPVALMGFVHLLVFVLPDDSGERVGFSVTILLSLAVYQSMLSEALPKASKPEMPVLSVKIFADLIISSLIQACVVVSQYLFIKEQKKEEPPLVIKGLVLCLLYMKRKRSVKATQNEDERVEDEPEHEEKYWKIHTRSAVDIHLFRRIFNITCGCFFSLAVLGTNIALVVLLREKTI
jgi:hypothetical protein